MSGCGFQLGDWDCREGGYMYDAGSGEGWCEEECDFICPHCRTKDYLESAKEEAESTSCYSGSYGSGTGVTIWTLSERTALEANRAAATRALIEIGIVNALEDADNEEGFSVVLCNTQPALQLLSDYDALAQQLAASETQCKRLLNGVKEDLAEVDRIQDEYTKQWRKSRERRIQLAARDKQLADAVGLLHRWLDMFECGIKSGDLNELWSATADYVDPTTIEQDKEND